MSLPVTHHPQPGEALASEVETIRACFVRRFGSEPAPGTIEPLLSLPLPPEGKAQLVYDIATLVHLVIDPILSERRHRRRVALDDAPDYHTTVEP